jgi:branched-chain amino acid transport system permease protein
MNLFLQQLVTGLSIGGIYALLAVGYAMIYSIFKFTNFAFGAIMMCGAFAAYYVVVVLEMSIWLGLLASILFSVFISIITELFAYRPLRKKKATRLFLMISAMGVNILITNLATILLGANVRKLSTPLSIGAIKIGNVVFGSLDIFSFSATLITLVVLWIYIEKTRSGIAIRASAHDTGTAGLMGINVNRVSLIVFTISGITAAIAGTFFGMKYAVYPAMASFSNKAFISSVIGGLGSLPGAVLGGFILGIIETMVSGYISTTFRDLFSFGIMVVVLVFFPNGLLGKNIKEKL